MHESACGAPPRFVDWRSFNASPSHAVSMNGISSGWIRSAFAVFEKDFKLELRSRYAINMLLMFVLTVIALLVLSAGREPLTDVLRAALLWIVVLFSAAIGLGRSFLVEEERGTVLLLRLNLRPSAVYTGKLFFNLVLMLVVEIVAVAAFMLLLNVSPGDPALMVLLIVLGALGLAGSTTLLAAIIARAAARGPLLPVLLFPILIPLMLTVVNATVGIIEGGGWDAIRSDIVVLISFAGAVISASYLLFDYVWND